MRVRTIALASSIGLLGKAAAQMTGDVPIISDQEPAGACGYSLAAPVSGGSNPAPNYYYAGGGYIYGYANLYYDGCTRNAKGGLTNGGPCVPGDSGCDGTSDLYIYQTGAHTGCANTASGHTGCITPPLNDAGVVAFDRSHEVGAAGAYNGKTGYY